jgi:hypothetical protein
MNMIPTATEYQGLALSPAEGVALAAKKAANKRASAAIEMEIASSLERIPTIPTISADRNSTT